MDQSDTNSDQPRLNPQSKIQNDFKETINYRDLQVELTRYGIPESTIDTIFTLNGNSMNSTMTNLQLFDNLLKYLSMLDANLDAIHKEFQVKKEMFDSGIGPIKSAKENEELNQYGIMKGSVLNISVISAKIESLILKNPFVVIKCEMETLNTNYIINSNDPV